MKKAFALGVALCWCLCLTPITILAQAKGDELSQMEKRIDKELLPAFQAQHPLNLEKGLDEFRQHFPELIGLSNLPTDPAIKVYDEFIPGPTDGQKLRLRIYKPIDLAPNAPGIYWLHGGGYMFGLPEQDEAQSLRWAKEIGAVVVAVDYRLAPENPYPAQIDDSYAGLVWFAQQAEALGVDKNRIAVAGSSAGGGLTAALTLMARDRNGPDIAFQMPLYPMLDDRFLTPASHEDFGLTVWNNTENHFAWKVYKEKLAKTDEVPAYMAPARAKDLSGLPPAYSMVGALDPFRDDTINYMARLAQAGVEVEFHLYPGAYHIFEVLASDTPYGQRAADEYVHVLKRALNK